MEIIELLKLMVTKGASDLHLTTASPPILRIDGELVPADHIEPVTGQDSENIFEQITRPEQRELFNRRLELDFAYSVPGLARFRVNTMRQRGTLSHVFRLVPHQIPSIEALGLPQICKELIKKSHGLILVTGATGTGKSTTLAAMVNYLNQTATRNVITIEDPIEFLFQNQKCIIRQRDIGDDTRSFADALIFALRHDPDVIVVGEMRDLATISAALSAAETGHLVLATLHTIDAVQTIDRIIDVFPHEQQRQIRMQLSQVLEAVISQKLLPRIGGGRILAPEVIVANNLIKRLILEAKSDEISINMEGSTLEGMVTMEQSLADLVNKKLITLDDAILRSNNPVKLKRFLEY